MSTPADATRQRSSAYELFILVLTVLSLAIMVVMMLPLDGATIQLLSVYDNVICVIFLIDFTVNLTRAKPKREYFNGRRGWLDLIGSLPSFGFFKYGALFRLARLSRFARISRLLRGKKKAELVADVLGHRGQYAAFITLLAAMVVLVITSTMVLQFESRSPDANITSGGDALWWAIVTITTVGYGDRFPVTAPGRLTGVFVMFAGVGIIGALASILASILVPPPKSDEEEQEAVAARGDVSLELADIKAELTALRRGLSAGGIETPGVAPPGS